MKRVVLVLKSGGDFSFADARLIAEKIRNQWTSTEPLEILCFWDRAIMEYNLGVLKIVPLNNDYSGVWARHILYSPEVEHLKPFLYLDLDTAVVKSVEHIFDIVEPYKDKFITLEDFWQPQQLATGVVWFPTNCKKTQLVHQKWELSGIRTGRMDYFLRKVTTQDLFWQQITNTIVDFKPKNQLKGLKVLPDYANLVCFHGKPRILQATHIPWVDKYCAI